MIVPISFEEIDRRVKAQNIHGWSFGDESRVLYREASEATWPIVEIGSYGGLSTAYLAAPGAQRVYAVDPFDHSVEQATTMGHKTPHEDPLRYFTDNMRAVGVAANIEVVRGLSHEVSLKVPCWIGLLFVDGEHTYRSCLQDLLLYGPKVRPGGAIILHDWNYGGAQGGFPIQRAARAAEMAGWLEEIVGLGTDHEMAVLRAPA